MAYFHNILVGLDLTPRARPVDGRGPPGERPPVAFPNPSAVQTESMLGPIAESLLRRAHWLARASAGRLTFFSALNERGPSRVLLDLEHSPPLSRTGEESPAGVLRELVEQERREGVDAHAVLATGKAGVELLQQVTRGGHDLLLVGSRDESGMWRALFGSTSFRLLRHCPCPVWVSRSAPDESQTGGRPRRILVASDLSPAAEQALRLGVAVVRRSEGARLHVLHVVDYPLDHHWAPHVSDVWNEAYRHQVRFEAEQTIRKQLKQAGDPLMEDRVEIHFVDGAGVPEDVIVPFIHDRAIDLVVLGTVARRGLWAVLLGNTAERVLPEVRCSVLAVKPPDFHPADQPQ